MYLQDYGTPFEKNNKVLASHTIIPIDIHMQ